MLRLTQRGAALPQVLRLQNKDSFRVYAPYRETVVRIEIPDRDHCLERSHRSARCENSFAELGPSFRITESR